MLAQRAVLAAATVARMSAARAAPRIVPGMVPVLSAAGPSMSRFTAVRFMSGEQKPEPISTEPPVESEAAPEKPAEPAAADPKDAAIQALKDENAKLKASVAELNSTRLRLLADMENVRLIAKRDVDTAKAYALQGFSKRLLDVVDNLGRAVTSVKFDEETLKQADHPATQLKVGVEATHRSLLKTLNEFGIVPFGKVGEKFDPSKCEAMMQVPPSDKVPADHVALVLKEGFMLKERVLRPAQVAVAVAQ